MISRRDFLKLAALGAGTLAFRPLDRSLLPEFPQADHNVNSPSFPSRGVDVMTEVASKPKPDQVVA